MSRENPKSVTQWRKMMKRTFFLSLMVTAMVFTAGTGLAADKVITMSTTTSTQASGLLDQLLPAFEADTGIQVKVIAKGTGAAIRDGMDGNVDLIFVHAKSREEKFIEEGYGTKRYAVMHNDFIILGPPGDSAGIKGMNDVEPALKKIAEAKAPFVSRGDDSGTHTKEQALWKASGVSTETTSMNIVKGGKEVSLSFTRPADSDSWYLSIGQGMGKTLNFADEKRGYTLADRGTYIKYKFGRDVPLDLDVMVEGDPMLANPYGVIPVNPEKHPHVKYDLARQFAEWLVSERGQSVIRDYRLLGKPLFYPDAIP
jgi:tungstate transport system substrate-binding protein